MYSLINYGNKNTKIVLLKHETKCIFICSNFVCSINFFFFLSFGNLHENRGKPSNYVKIAIQFDINEILIEEEGNVNVGIGKMNWPQNLLRELIAIKKNQYHSFNKSFHGL